MIIPAVFLYSFSTITVYTSLFLPQIYVIFIYSLSSHSIVYMPLYVIILTMPMGKVRFYLEPCTSGYVTSNL